MKGQVEVAEVASTLPHNKHSYFLGKVTSMTIRNQVPLDSEGQMVNGGKRAGVSISETANLLCLHAKLSLASREISKRREIFQ